MFFKSLSAGFVSSDNLVSYDFHHIEKHSTPVRDVVSDMCSYREHILDIHPIWLKRTSKILFLA